MSRAREVDGLLDTSLSFVRRTVKHLDSLLPDEAKEPWDLEREAFGIEDPLVTEKRLLEEEREAAGERPNPDERSRWRWWEEMRRTWKPGPRKTRRWNR